MKTLLVLVCMFMTAASPLRAQKSGGVGAGVILGDPSGVTAKFWLTDSRALDAGLGFDTNLSLYGDYLWHSWKVLPQPSDGRLPVYLGLGLQTWTASSNGLGLRAVAGVAYWLPHSPVEIFLEIVPVLRLSHGDGVDLNAGLGLRYYFK